MTFAHEDVRVVAVADGQEAIQRLETERPDVVLADIGMPKMDGYDVATFIKQSPAFKHVPVLLLTGAFEPIDERRARATGCDGVLVKPFEPQLLVSRVRELLAGKHSPELWPADLPRVDLPAPAAPPPPVAAAPPPAPVPAPVAPPIEPSTPRVVIKPSAAPAPPKLPPPNVERMPEPGELSATPKARPAFESGLDHLDEAFARLEPSAAPAELDDKSAFEFAKDLNELRGAIEGEDEPGARKEWDLALPPHEEPAMSESDSLDAELPGRPTTEFGDWDVAESAFDRAAAMAPENPEVHSPPSTTATSADWSSSGTLPPNPSAPPASRPAASAPVAPAPMSAASSSPSAPASIPASTPAEAPAAAAAVSTPPSPAAPAESAKVSLAGAFSALLSAEQTQPAYRPPVSTAAISEAAIEEVVRRVLGRMTDETVRKVVLDTAERLIKEEIAKIKTKPS